MSRVVFTVVMGDSTQVDGAFGLGRSLKLIGDPTRRTVFTDRPDLPWLRCFHEIRPAESIDSAAGELISEGYQEVIYLAPEYLAFNRFSTLARAAQASSAADVALESQTQEGTWDDRRVRIWTRSPIQFPPDFVGVADRFYDRLQLDVRANVCRWVSQGSEIKLVEPYLFRPSSSEALDAYRRQLKALENLDRYEQAHGFGYVSPMHKFRRSIEKRILKLQGRL